MQLSSPIFQLCYMLRQINIKYATSREFLKLYILVSKQSRVI